MQKLAAIRSFRLSIAGMHRSSPSIRALPVQRSACFLVVNLRHSIVVVQKHDYNLLLFKKNLSPCLA